MSPIEVRHFLWLQSQELHMHQYTQNNYSIYKNPKSIRKYQWCISMIYSIYQPYKTNDSISEPCNQRHSFDMRFIPNFLYLWQCHDWSNHSENINDLITILLTNACALSPKKHSTLFLFYCSDKLISPTIYLIISTFEIFWRCCV